MSELIYCVEDIFDTGSPQGCLAQYRSEAFMIPSYQRGYKWGAEENQPVERLLTDLTQAWRANAKEYLLQAITVKKVSGGESAYLEVIDGQQRLTTLFILLHVLDFLADSSGPAHATNPAAGKLRYQIRHKETRLGELVTGLLEKIADASPLSSGTASFQKLKVDHEVDQEAHQDIHYLKCAVLRCYHDMTVTRAKTAGDRASFHAYLQARVKLMVNAVDAHVSGEIIFGNLNTNRVPLTETELIKGLLLTRVAREPVGTRVPRYREVLEMRIQVGRKWDELVHWANLPAIRNLYFRETGDGAEGGIRGLLELVALRMGAGRAIMSKGAGEKRLFEFLLAGKATFRDIFHLLAETQARLQDWYAHDATYHLLGFCLVTLPKSGKRLPLLAELLETGTKTKLKADLRARLRKTLMGENASAAAGEFTVNGLGYGEDSQRIQAILLALSVFRPKNLDRFNFSAYQEEKWSLEHIFPQNPFGKGATLTEKQKAISRLVKEQKGILNEAAQEKLTNLGKSNDAAMIETATGELLGGISLLHGIGNLCLLSAGDNAAMGCGMFTDKRGVIRGRIARGRFVPHHTYEVFSKMITGDDDNLDTWSEKDIQAHEREILRRIKEVMEEEA